MRRYRFGRIAAVVAAAYLLAVLGLAVFAVAAGDVGPLWRVVAYPGVFIAGELRPWPWLVGLLVLVAVVQAWAYWQLLRGRLRGTPAGHGREAGLLRAALYVDAAVTVFYTLVMIVPWQEGFAATLYPWSSFVFVLLQLAVTWLFFRVLAGTTPLWLRLLILVTGTLCAADSLISIFEAGFGLEPFGRIDALAWARELSRPAWMVPLLVAQARDPRWSRATVWIGVVIVALSLTSPASFGYFSYRAANEVPVELIAFGLLSSMSVFGVVWQARSAHDLGSLQPQRARRRPVRVPAGRWPLAVVAILLPLLPAAANLTRGVPFWSGPTTEVYLAVHRDAGSAFFLLWFALDVLVGVGAPALLIAAAVLRRTRRFARVTVVTLLAAAALGAAGALTPLRDRELPFAEELPPYPASLFAKDGTLVSAGISPAWYSLALAASALLLLSRYAAPPAERRRRHVLVAALAGTLTHCLLPAADQESGPITTAEECNPADYRRLPEEEPERMPETFVCAMRGGQGNGVLPELAATTPDHVVLAHGRRLCGVYTRNDPAELARLKLDRAALAYSISGICPGAAAVVRAAKDGQDREMAEIEADGRRMCAATPRHKPLIKPAAAVRVKEPQLTDYGVMESVEAPEDEDYDPYSGELLDEAQDNGLAAARPGHLMVLSHSDFDLCVTLETYRRRPPVETRGWDHVVEVGYDSPGGSIVLSDAAGGTELPDLALDGRAGHYRIRVHYAWFPWKGEGMGGQRLLIMAYPGPGDRTITYRRPARPR
ncbi:hypothetical protein [Nonomuraea zeae]|uniref:Uncharacterized protein n=1 Tax=Nonomuraea zeae TaxID=1642303 RepID=A0A5S4FCB0_9ACTN|nr:hypothetical protein [Nonomuraea zeae]TMR15780.1 hypothetical protein ETD85_55905 [Nonomuraea zeae]